MGEPMAAHLHYHGMLTAVWNRTKLKADNFAGHTGVQNAMDLASLAEQCQLIFICVSKDEDVEAVIDGLLPFLKPYSIIVDTSTISPYTAVEIASNLKQHKIEFLDAPVTGGVEGAKNGTLSVMVGGNTATLEKVEPALKSFASRVVHMGPHGKGQSTKAVNQLMAAGINQAVTEALSFAEAMQLPLDKTIEVISGGAAGNWFLNHRGISMTQSQYTPGFRVALHYKDLLICRQIAEKMQIKLDTADSTCEDYHKLIESGFGDEDISALYRLKKHTPISEN